MNPELIQAARGDKTADLLLTNLKLVNVYTGQIEPSEIAILGDTIVGVGPGYDAAQVVDLGGRYVSPGFINAHVHVESSMVTPSEFARAVVALGTTTAVTDPHEMANVCGLEGVRFMLDDGRKAPMTLYVNAPSCVPATSMSTSGAVLNAEHLSQLKNDPNVIGLAEVMNFPGVIHGARDVLDKIEAFADRPIDGHAPTVSGKDLNAYVTAGVGSDHECVTKEEALEKIARGMRVLIREGTAERNLAELLPAVMDNPSAARRCCFCTDDSHPAKLIDEGDVGAMVVAAIEAGLPPVTAIQMATLNAAEWFRLYDRGAIAP
ncbi:MAG: amidohydrolase family protein, partial [Chloroflexota bacterium]